MTLRDAPTRSVNAKSSIMRDLKNPLAPTGPSKGMSRSMQIAFADRYSSGLAKKKVQKKKNPLSEGLGERAAAKRLKK